nr:hypothetical protein [Tanacetum cinerariifolium]
VSIGRKPDRTGPRPIWSKTPDQNGTVRVGLRSGPTRHNLRVFGSLEDISSSKRSKYKCLYSSEDKLEEKKGLKLTMTKSAPVFQNPDKDVEKPKKKRVAEETLLRESFKKLKAVKVSGSDSTQETPSNDPKEMSKEDVQNMLEIVPVSKFKVEALQVKYPIVDWEIHSEGSRTYWKIIRVGGITEAYQSFEDMLKGFDREDLVALWILGKEKFSSAVPREDNEKALWVELTRLFEPSADDVFWKLQRYMHDPLTWKLYTNCGVHHVSSTRRHNIFMLTEKDYPCQML